MKKYQFTKHCIKYPLSVATFAAFINVASAGPIALVNQGFETGDLTGWDTIGEVTAAGVTNVTTSNDTEYLISPNETTMAFLDSFGASVAEIESFLGIASGSLFTAQGSGPSVVLDGDFGDGPGEGFGEGASAFLIDEPIEVPIEVQNDAPNGNYNLTNGSAISQSFLANAGDTIDMSWNYAARDYIPYTDPSFAVLVAPDGTAIVDVLATTTGPGLATGSDGISGVFSFAQQLTQTGEYTLGFAVTNSGDTALNATLFLDDGAGDCNPSCNDLGSPENPLMPIDDDTPESFDFSFTVTPGNPVFIDPVIAVGYNYIVNSGPNVASVILPNIGDGQYQVFGWDGTAYSVLLGDAFANIAFNFMPGGVDKFQVLGIETSAGLDPTDSMAFVTGLDFVSAGDVNFSQIAVTFNTDNTGNSVPEPAVLSLFSLGFLSIFYLRRRRSQHSKAL